MHIPYKNSTLSATKCFHLATLSLQLLQPPVVLLLNGLNLGPREPVALHPAACLSMVTLMVVLAVP
jgi:hypothetical protein